MIVTFFTKDVPLEEKYNKRFCNKILKTLFQINPTKANILIRRFKKMWDEYVPTGRQILISQKTNFSGILSIYTEYELLSCTYTKA